MQDVVLHGYQSEIKQNIQNSWNSGNKNVLFVLPTGGGKSVVMSDFVHDGAMQNMNQTVIAHRNELVSQMSMHIAERGVYHRIIGPNDTISQIIGEHREAFSGHSFINLSAPCSVAGVDTIMSRYDDLTSWGLQQSRWIIDEAHHVLRENKWGKAVKLFANAHGLGATATARRADGMGLGSHADGCFDDLVIGPNMQDLIRMGNLCPYEIACPISDAPLLMSDKDIGESGDYSPQKMRKAAQKSRIVGDVVTEYAKHALFRQAICFATDVETAGEIATSFNKMGIRAASLSAKTPTAVRKKFVREFRMGILKVLVNVDLFGEGFDCPACEVVIMARPTASLGLYLQMVGRCLRTAIGKEYGLIIDHVGNIIRHKFPDKVHHWSLDRAEKGAKKKKDPEELDMVTCRTCTLPYESHNPCCTWCGAYPPLPVPRERTIQMVAGNLILLDREKLAAMRAATVMESAGDVAERVAAYKGHAAGKYQADRHIEKIASQAKLKEVIAQWAGIQRAKNRPDDEIYKRFYHGLGMDVLTALANDRTREEYDKSIAIVEGWYNGAH